MTLSFLSYLYYKIMLLGRLEVGDCAKVDGSSNEDEEHSGDYYGNFGTQQKSFFFLISCATV